jgi:hypothetical protein
MFTESMHQCVAFQNRGDLSSKKKIAFMKAFYQKQRSRQIASGSRERETIKIYTASNAKKT